MASIKGASLGLLKLVVVVVVAIALVVALLNNFLGDSTFDNLHVDTNSGIDGLIFSLLKDFYMVVYDIANGVVKGVKEFSDWASQQAQSSSSKNT